MSRRIQYLEPEFVDSFPQTMKSGVLYVSIPFGTCSHRCCCGCGEEVVTPLSPAQWCLSYDGETISLRPSVGNWSLDCQAHYWVHNGHVHWSRRYTRQEVSENRYADQAELEGHLMGKVGNGPFDRLRRAWRRLTQN